MDPDELVKCGSLSAASAERLKRYLTLEEDLEKGRERQQLYKKNRAARPTVLAPAESRPLGRNYFSRIRVSPIKLECTHACTARSVPTPSMP